MKKHLWVAVTLGLLIFALAPSARAQQGPEKGGHEVQVWTGGGTSRNGGAR